MKVRRAAWATVLEIAREYMVTVVCKERSVVLDVGDLSLVLRCRGLIGATASIGVGALSSDVSVMSCDCACPKLRLAKCFL